MADKQVIVNLYEFEKRLTGGKPIYLHMGHLIDKRRTCVLKNGYCAAFIEIQAMVAERIYWAEDEDPSRGCISNPQGTNQPRHGRSAPTGCGTAKLHDQRRNKQYDPSASASD